MSINETHSSFTDQNREDTDAEEDEKISVVWLSENDIDFETMLVRTVHHLHLLQLFTSFVGQMITPSRTLLKPLLLSAPLVQKL